jgi:ubiquinone biosynthesis protein
LALQPLRRAYRTFGNLRRLRRIVAVLLRHGMDDLVQRLGLDSWLRAGLRPFRRSKASVEPAPATFAQRVRHTLQELGPTFVKLGQMLSMREDLVPKDFARELAALQDAVRSSRPPHASIQRRSRPARWRRCTAPRSRAAPRS